MKKLMAQEETMVPNLFYNLKRALMPLLHDDTYVAMAAVTTAIEENNATTKSRAPGSGAAKRAAISAGAEGDSKRSKVDAAAAAVANTESAAAVVGDEAKGAAEEMDVGEEDGAEEEPLPVCGADGGYCPPCYELA